MQIRTSLQWQNHVPFNLMPRPAVDPWLSKTKRFRWAYPELRYSMPHAIPKNTGCRPGDEVQHVTPTKMMNTLYRSAQQLHLGGPVIAAMPMEGPQGQMLNTPCEEILGNPRMRKRSLVSHLPKTSTSRSQDQLQSNPVKPHVESATVMLGPFNPKT